MDSAIVSIYYRHLIAKPTMELILLCLCKFVKVLMEKDDIRDEFFTAFHQIVKETIIDCPETLKPF